MALSISAVLPSGKRLPSLVGDLSWTGQQVKTALNQHFDGSTYVSALLHKDQIIGSDQTLEQAGVGLDGNTESGSVDLGIVVSELLGLADVAELPGMTAEYKFDHWSGEEIYPDEEDLYRKKAAETECYFLKRRAPAEDAVVRVAMSQEWTDFYDDYASKHEGQAPGRFANVYSSGLIQKMRKDVDRELKTALAMSYEGLDRLEFSVENNIGATAKYNLIDGRSSQPIRFADHETRLYIHVIGSAALGREEMRIGFQSAYLSDDRFCGVHRAFYM